jgi:hypothetical protein
VIIFGKITAIYNCKLITNSTVPSIYSKDEVLADGKSFESYFGSILEKSKTKTKGMMFTRTHTGDYIFSREEILRQAALARGILKKRVKR